MPRAGTANAETGEDIKTTEVKDGPEGKFEVELPVIDLGKIKAMKPYSGRESLGDPTFDKKGRMIKAGAPAFFMTGNKLIAKYKNRGGIATRLAKVFKMTRPVDKELRHALKKQGIPGA